MTDEIAFFIAQAMVIALVSALIIFLSFSAIFDALHERKKDKLKTMSGQKDHTRQKSEPWPRLQESPSPWWKYPIYWSAVSPKILKASLATSGVLLLFALILRSSSLFFLGCLSVAALAILVIKRANARRKKCLQQLPHALEALVQGLRAGYALPASLALVERETHEPVRCIFSALSRAQAYHLPFAQAVHMVDQELRLPEWSLVTEALHIQSQTGGNMIPVLTKINEGLRDQWRTEQEIQTATASGKFSGLLIAALVPFSFFLFYFFSPSYINVLIQSALGLVLLGSAGLLELIGFLLIWRIVSLDY